MELGDIEDEFDLLAAADYLLCPEVFQMALSALKNHITDENVILALFFSKAYNFQELEQFCWKYIGTSSLSLRNYDLELLFKVEIELKMTERTVLFC